MCGSFGCLETLDFKSLQDFVSCLYTDSMKLLTNFVNFENSVNGTVEILALCIEMLYDEKNA